MPRCCSPPARLATRSPISRQERRRSPSTVAMPVGFVCNTLRRPWVTFINIPPCFQRALVRLLSGDHTGGCVCRKRGDSVSGDETRALAVVRDYRHPACKSGALGAAKKRSAQRSGQEAKL